MSFRRIMSGICANRGARRGHRITALMTLLCLTFSAALTHARDLTISGVQPDRTQASLGKEESVTFRFELSAPAKVTLQLFDGRDLLIREIASQGALRAGEQSLRWDLCDHARRPVPAEAYTYVLKALGEDGKIARYDLTDLTGGETLSPRDVKWDAKTGLLSYVLDKPARVNVRLGLNDGGPLLRTLIDWVARPSGVREEKWDGKDASGVLDVGAHPRLAIGVQAFALPQNAILIGDPQAQVALIERLPAQRVQRPKAKVQPKHMYSHAQQPLEARGDFKVQLSLPNGLQRTAAGLPVISTSVPVRLEVDAKDRDRALARRFEPVFFIDGQFAFENEVGFVPMTWNFDPAALNEGEHFITVNLRGYEGNFGMATVKIFVQRVGTASTR